MEEIKRTIFLAYHDELEQKRLNRIDRFLLQMGMAETRLKTRIIALT